MHTDEIPLSTTAERQAVASEAGAAPDKDWVIVTRGLKRDYDMGGEVVHALRGVDIAIRRNEYVAIMGPSGSGSAPRKRSSACSLAIASTTGRMSSPAANASASPSPAP